MNRGICNLSLFLALAYRARTAFRADALITTEIYSSLEGCMSAQVNGQVADGTISKSR
jgi:hypothetical protein